MMTSEAITRNVRVRVRTRFDPARSNPPDNLWFFEYTVQISNEGPDTVQLVSRHWIITDALNQVHEVQGLGVVGKQPILAPGEGFEYTSGCPLTTPFGSMRGTYQMLTDRQERFNIEVAPFVLTEPYDTVH